MEVRSAADFLDRRYALDTVESIIGGARAILKGVAPDDPVYAFVEPRVRLIEERVSKQRMARKQVIVRVVAVGGSAAVALIIVAMVLARTSSPTARARPLPSERTSSAAESGQASCFSSFPNCNRAGEAYSHFSSFPDGNTGE